MVKPRAFVIMPYGVKEVVPVDGQPVRKVNFDDLYQQLIKPALERAGCEPFRADESYATGSILTGMFFELLTADIVVADESIPNPNVYYECGIRDAARRSGFIPIHGDWGRPPFDIAVALRFAYKGPLWLDGAVRDQTAVANEVEALTSVFQNAIAAGSQSDGSLFYHEMVGLTEPDRSKLQTTKGKYFEAMTEDWVGRIKLAEEKGLPGDILTLADEAPTREHWNRLRLRAARGMMNLQRFAAARDLLLELKRAFPNAMSARDRAQLPLAYARLGQLQEARAEAERLESQFGHEAEVTGMLGSVYKEIWRSHWEKIEDAKDRLSRAAATAMNASLSLESYHRGLWKNLGSHWLGVNVLTMSRLLEHVATTTGRRINLPNIFDAGDLPTVIRVAVNHELRQLQGNEPDRVWALASKAELAVLAGDAEAAASDYGDAASTPGVTYFNVDSMRRQLRTMSLLGFQPAATARCERVLEEAQQFREPPRPTYKRVVVCSGHMTDAPGRSSPRFPSSRVEAVKARVAATLDEWDIKEDDLAICGGARGADLLFAELCRARGARVRLLVPLPEPEFIKASVSHPELNWTQRYHELKADRERVEVWFQDQHLGVPRQREDVWERNNLWIINTARIEAPPDPIYAILVWDGRKTGDGKGGTSHFAELYREISAGMEPVVISPTDTLNGGQP